MSMPVGIFVLHHHGENHKSSKQSRQMVVELQIIDIRNQPHENPIPTHTGCGARLQNFIILLSLGAVHFKNQLLCILYLYNNKLFTRPCWEQATDYFTKCYWSYIWNHMLRWKKNCTGGNPPDTQSKIWKWISDASELFCGCCSRVSYEDWWHHKYQDILAQSLVFLNRHWLSTDSEKKNTWSLRFNRKCYALFFFCINCFKFILFYLASAT